MSVTSPSGAASTRLGYRILDLTDHESMFCGKILADLGAAVTVLEPPEGHPARSRPPTGRGGEGVQWWSYSTGKSSFVVDGLRNEADVLDLAKSADAILISDPPPMAVAPGLSERLHDANPSLVVTRMSPFGSWGPYRHFVASDLVLQALSGYLRLNGDPDRPPVRISHELAPLIGAAYAAFNTVVALRGSTERRLVDVSSQDAAGWQLLNAPATPVLEHKDPTRSGIYSQAMEQIQGIPFPLIYECRDGHILFFVIGGPGGGRSFYELRDWMRELGTVDPVLEQMKWEEIDFLRDQAAKELHAATVTAWVAFFKTQTKEEIFARALARGILIAPVNDMADVVAHPQLADRQFFVRSEGAVVPGGFAVVDGARLQTNTPPPRPGEQHEVPAHARARSLKRDLPYEGLKILDLGWMYAGPASIRTFAELGATVVRIESESRVDLTRTSGPFKDDAPGLNRAQLFMEANAGKLSVGLNLDQEQGVGVMRRLALEWADVLVASFPPGPLEKWGLLYDQVKAQRPDMIVAQTSQMGQTGPQAGYRGFGYNSASIAGFLSLTGWPDRTPTLFHGAYSDILTPPMFAIALATAIDRRERTGQGGSVDLSQLELSAYFLREPLIELLHTNVTPMRMGNRSRSYAPQGVYPCHGADNWVAISCANDEQWCSLASVAGLDDLADDATLATAAGRSERHDEIDERLKQWTVAHESVSLMYLLQRARVPAAVVWRLSEWLEDPQLASRGYFRWLHHPVMDYVPYLGPPAISNSFANIVRRGPLLGEHTTQVLSQQLGLDDSDISDLVAGGAIEIMVD